jgi:hypothetical protein
VWGSLRAFVSVWAECSSLALLAIVSNARRSSAVVYRITVSGQEEAHIRSDETESQGSRSFSRWRERERRERA